MTKSEKRVAVAKDAMAWVRARALEAGHWYCTPEQPPREYHNKQQLRDVVLGKCEVCAIGALFLANAVRFGNTTVLDEWEGRYHEKLVGLFSEEQLSMIENAYERGESSHYSANSNATQRAVQFGDQYVEDKDRLIAILKNIVVNGGTFKP